MIVFNICYLSVSVGQKSGHDNWVLWFCISHKAAVMVLLGLQSFEGSTRSGSASQPTQAVVGRIRFLAGCWMEGLDSS